MRRIARGVNRGFACHYQHGQGRVDHGAGFLSPGKGRKGQGLISLVLVAGARGLFVKAPAGLAHRILEDARDVGAPIDPRCQGTSMRRPSMPPASVQESSGAHNSTNDGGVSVRICTRSGLALHGHHGR
jgi:hypothetical protein